MASSRCGPILSQLKIESYAIGALRKMGIAESWPISIEHIAEKLDGKLKVVPGMQSCGFEAGIARIRGAGSGPKFLVCVDQTLYNGSRSHLRIMVAEEVAHLIADYNEVATVRTIEDTIALHDRDGWEDREINRERLGRALLSPLPWLQKLIREIYRDVVRDIGFQSAESVRHQVAVRAAIRVGIPLDEMCRRLREAPADFNERIQASALNRESRLRLDLLQSPKHSEPMEEMSPQKRFPQFYGSEAG